MIVSIDLSQEIFAINMLRSLKSSLKHRRKHVLRPLQLYGDQAWGGFPLIAEFTGCHTFTKEINHASARCQYFNENFYCKNCLRVFSAMTGKPALTVFSKFLHDHIIS